VFVTWIVNLRSLTESVLRLPVVGVLIRAYLEGRRDHAKDMSASIAFFSFFSIFPLLLGVIAGGSLFVEASELQSRLETLLSDAFPAGTDFVTNNVDALFRLRGAAGLVSIAGLLWSASKMSGAVNRGINQALGLKRTYAFYWSPVRNLGMTITVSILLFCPLVFSTAVELFPRLDFGFLGNWMENVLTFADGHVSSFVVVFSVLTLLYKFVPYRRPLWREVLPGAVVAGLLFELGKSGFVIYINNVGRFDAFYGPVSSIIVLLLWLYFSARVLLYGAELIAVNRRNDRYENNTA